MLGTFLNMGTVLLGTGIGLLAGSRITPRMRTTAFVALGLVNVLLGLQMAFKTQQILVPMIAMLVGGLLGEALRIDDLIAAVGRKISGGKGQVAEAFINTSVLFCVGAMTVLGAMEEGLQGTYKIYAVKAMLDGVAAIAFAATLGWGVALTTVTILVVQGGLTLGAGLAQPLLTPAVVAEISATGGLILVALALNLLDIKRVPVASFLPALALPVVLVPLFARFMP